MNFANIGDRVGIATAAAAAAMFLTIWVMGYIADHNRRTECDKNETIAAPSNQEISWQIVHIRDDIGSLCGVLSITNMLLAAILAVSVVR
jgi:hypothetical protein